jgi:hypothetical protein
MRGRRGRDRVVDGFITTYAIKRIYILRRNITTNIVSYSIISYCYSILYIFIFKKDLKTYSRHIMKRQFEPILSTTNINT